MEIPIQHDVYIWANYSVSSYLNFIPICWNVWIWLKYDFMHIFMHHLSLYFETTAQIPEVEFGGKYGYMRANTDIWGQIRIIEGQYGYLPRICPECKYPTLTFSYYWTYKNEHIATKYVIKPVITPWYYYYTVKMAFYYSYI